RGDLTALTSRNEGLRGLVAAERTGRRLDEIAGEPMDDQGYRLAGAHIREPMRSVRQLRPVSELTAVRCDRWAPPMATGHVRPVVRSPPAPTAHPAAEAWREQQFARLQQRLAATTSARRGVRRRSVVVLPSRSVDRWHEPAAETRSYEERLLSFVFD